MKQKWVYGTTCILVLLLCFHAEEASNAAESAIILCAHRVIPNLFPFFVLSSFMVQTGFVTAAGKSLAPVARRVFHVSGTGAAVLVVGLLCGYPTGAKTVAELFRNQQIEKEEAQRLLPFCNNAGPLFVIGTVGGMLQDVALGRKLYMIHAFSAILLGVLLSFWGKEPKECSAESVHVVRLSTAFSTSVCKSVETMLYICGYIVFFAVISSFIPKNGSLFPGVLLEVTLGVQTVVQANLLPVETLMLLSAVIGFGGVCVLLQVWGEVSRVGLSVRGYILGKILQMGIAAALVPIWENKIYVCVLFVLLFSVYIFRTIKLTNGFCGGIIKPERK